MMCLEVADGACKACWRLLERTHTRAHAHRDPFFLVFLLGLLGYALFSKSFGRCRVQTCVHVQTLKVTRSLVQSVMAGIGPSSLAASFRRFFKVGGPATAYRVLLTVLLWKTLRERLCLSVVCVYSCFVFRPPGAPSKRNGQRAGCCLARDEPVVLLQVGAGTQHACTDSGHHLNTFEWVDESGGWGLVVVGLGLKRNAVPTWKAHCVLLGGLDLEDEVPSSQAVARLDAHLPANAQRTTRKHIEQLCEGSRTSTHPEGAVHSVAQAGDGKRT